MEQRRGKCTRRQALEGADPAESSPRAQEPAAEGEEEAAAPAPAASAEALEPGAASRRKARKRPRS